MSGHSKWAQIHRQKGVADARRGAVFTKMANVVTLAARAGGGDPETNFRLRLAVDQAKAVNMPKDNIERAIKRGTGELAGGPIDEVAYEGFGPDGIAVIIECLTDNRNRTSANIKHLLSTFGGSLGGPNSVAWMFEHKGVIGLNQLDEATELELIDAGADDIGRTDEGATVYVAPNQLEQIKKWLDQRGIAVEYAEMRYVPKETKQASPEQQEKLEKLFAALEDDEDVHDYFSAAD